MDRNRTVLLVGAGHAHLFVASAAGVFAANGIDVVLADPGDFWYSGLATGMLGGMYKPAEDRVDACSLVERNGGRFVRDRVIAVDRDRRVARTESGGELAYDVISLNVGSEIDTELDYQGRDSVFPVKPIRNLRDLRHHLEEGFASGERARRIVVIGGGATGCETAANIEDLARRRASTVELTLATREERLLPLQRAVVSRRVERALRERGVRLEPGCEIVAIEQDVAVAGDGRRIPWDVLVLATGLRAPEWLQRLGLPFDPAGIRVDPYLRSIADERVFAVGDCMSLDSRDLPNLGVFAVKAAPVLINNLLASVIGRPLIEYRPQKRWLSILNMGWGRGLALWDGLYWYGRASLWVKDWIDRRFLARFRADGRGQVGR